MADMAAVWWVTAFRRKCGLVPLRVINQFMERSTRNQ